MFKDLRKPDFNQLVKALFREKTDRIPLIELGIHPNIKKTILGRPVNDISDDIEFMSSMGYDFIKIQPSINFNLNQKKADNPDSEYKNAPDRAWATEHNGVITSWEDFEKYNWPRKEDIDYSKFEKAKGQLPEGMGIIGQYGDIFTMVWEMMGFETFAMAVYMEPDLVKAMFDKVGGLIMSMFETMAEMDHVGALWFSDDIAYASGLMMNPDFYREYFFPYLQKIGKLTQKRNIPFIYHTDGLLYDVMDDIIKAGVNGLHPIEPKAMDIKEVQAKYGDKLCLCGGVEVDTLCRGSREEVEALTLSLLEKTGGKGWAAGSSNSVPDYADVDNYITMVKTILKNGKL